MEGGEVGRGEDVVVRGDGSDLYSMERCLKIVIGSHSVDIESRTLCIQIERKTRSIQACD